jgi:hypothetical protein
MVRQCGCVQFVPKKSDGAEEDDEDELESYDDNDNDELDRQSQQAKAEAIMKLAVEALADPSPSTGHCTDNYGLHNSTIFIKRIMLIFYRYC